MACAAPRGGFELDYGYGPGRSLRAPGARAELYVAELGAGAKTVVLLHPWGANMAIWRDLAPRLATARRVVLIDLPGHGRSSKAPGRYPVRRLARGVLDVLDALAIERASLVGNSLGGAVALELAIEAPERVDRLVTIGAPGGRDVAAPVAGMVRAAVQPRNVETLSDGAVRLGWRIVSPDGEDLAARWIAAKDDPDWPRFAAAAASALDEVIDFRPAVERIRAPTLVVQGSLDVVVWPWLGRRLAERIPGAELAWMEGCGHCPQLDCADALAARLERFLGP